MVKKIKYYLIVLLLILLVFGAMFFIFGYDSVYHGSTSIDNEKDNNSLNASNAVLFNNPSVLALKQKVYLGVPFEKELQENSRIFVPEDLEFLKFFSSSGIKNILQIKRDFLYLQSVVLIEENFAKNSVLRHVIHIADLNNKRNMEKILDSLLIDECAAAVDLANMVHFISDNSIELFTKWKKNLEDYVAVDNLMKKYL